MTTHDKIELPPLPAPDSNHYDNGIFALVWKQGKLEAFARAAIEADRKRRGEPVAYGVIASNTGRISILVLPRDFESVGLDQMLPEHVVPLYDAPQPAEPCVAPMSDKPVCGSQNGKCETQPANPAIKESLTVAEPVREVSDLVSRLRDADRPLLQQGKFSDVRNLLREAADFIASYGAAQPSVPVDIRQEVIETLEMILAADWRKWEELASPDEFVRWAKSRANYALSIINEDPQPADPIGASTLHNAGSGAQNGIHAPQPAEQVKHDLYKTGDKDAPEQILDRNREVVLDCCKKCGKFESQLSEPCVVEPVKVPSDVGIQR